MGVLFGNVLSVKIGGGQVLDQEVCSLVELSFGKVGVVDESFILRFERKR